MGARPLLAQTLRSYAGRSRLAAERNDPAEMMRQVGAVVAEMESVAER